MSDPASLQNLHSIVLPPWSGLFPFAPGWYLLLALLVLFFFRGGVNFIKNRKKNAYRRKALHTLEALERKTGSKECRQSLQLLPQLLKSTALQAYPRPLVASLYGQAWLGFLDKTSHSDRFQNGPGRILIELSCARPEAFLEAREGDVRDLFALCRHWIWHHVTVDELGDDNV